ncbi:hypothetical protein E4U53_000984 [Claviceps sorghi]|nr:hypothetical protein E4U53_000984 [Claviceps sorghi]
MAAQKASLVVYRRLAATVLLLTDAPQLSLLARVGVDNNPVTLKTTAPSMDLLDEVFETR